MKKQASKNRRKYIYIAIAVAAALLALGWWLRLHPPAVLQPAGPIAHKERSLMLTATLLGLAVIIPVYILTVLITLKYRVENKHAKKYQPTWDHSRVLETVWWAIPIAIIAVLSVIAWQSSYALDPFKPLASKAKPLNIQVVALDWKWLFIYPGQQVASVNELQLPVGRPVSLQITSDSVMNSFWLPRLSGQIYAMPGMSTELHLMADSGGTYDGASANISGSGFAGMAFTAPRRKPGGFRCLDHAHAPPGAGTRSGGVPRTGQAQQKPAGQLL